jgi:hypothetical protein
MIVHAAYALNFHRVYALSTTQVFELLLEYVLLDSFKFSFDMHTRYRCIHHVNVISHFNHIFIEIAFNDL